MISPQPPLGSPVLPLTKERPLELTSDASAAQFESHHSASQPALGVPPGAVLTVEPISEETEKQLLAAEKREQQDEEDQNRGKIFGGAPEVRIPSILLNTTFLLTLAAICSIMALFIFAEALSVLAQIPLLPHRLQIFSYAVIILLSTIVAIFCIRLIVIYCRIRTTKRIRLKGLSEFNERSNMRQLCASEVNEAREHLLDYLDLYEIEEGRLKKLGFTTVQIARLTNHKTKLIDQTVDLGPSAWIHEFKQGYQQVLDEAADQCIRRHAIGVGLRTAALPFALADTLVVLYSSVALIGDLSRIYNLKLGRFATLVVTGWAASQSVLAGRIEDWHALDKINEEVLSKTFGDDGLRMFQDAIVTHGGNAVAQLVRIVSKRGAHAVEQGVLQGVLISRLGKRTKNWLRMVE